MSQTFLTIIMPALNEARHIEAAIASILPRDAPFEYELLVLDGGSTDGTGDIVSRLSARDARIRLVYNPRKTQAAAMNLATQLADPRSTFLLRADCHAVYPPRFAEICLEAITRQGCSSVAVPMLTLGKTCIQRGVAAAQNSRLGNGGSAHRTAGTSGYVDHGHHALFSRAAFTEVGGYDESMPANEDAELDRRLTAKGHRIWLCGDATIQYFPRATFSSLARQYFSYGWGRATTLVRHGGMPRIRQILPVVAFAACAASVALAFLDIRFLVVAIAYLLLCLAWGLVAAVRERSACAVLCGPAAITMHMSWAVGFLSRLALSFSSGPAKRLVKPDARS